VKRKKLKVSQTLISTMISITPTLVIKTTLVRKLNFTAQSLKSRHPSQKAMKKQKLLFKNQLKS